MAEISVRGYVNRPETKSNAKGEFQVFSLSEKQKSREEGGKPTRNYYDCASFNSELPRVADGQYVTVKGYLSFYKYVSRSGKNEGKEMESKKVFVTGIEIAPPRDGAPAAQADSSDPWELKE